MRRRQIEIFAVALLGLSYAVSARAAIYSVGTGAGCSHSTVQDAVDAAASNAGLDVVRVSRSVAHTAQAMRISGQQLTLDGGYPDCTGGAFGVWT